MTTITNKRKKNHQFNYQCLVVLLLLFFCTCTKKTDLLASGTPVTPTTVSTTTEDLAKNTKQGSEQLNSSTSEQDNLLKKLLTEGSYESINEAKRQGKAALPIIRPFLNDANYQIRQMAVMSAGAIGVSEAADILASGLKDSNINVRLAAAKELSKQAYPGATQTVLEVIKTSPDQAVKEFSILAAGYLPGEQTLAVLRPLALSKSGLSEKDFIANNAVYALAKLKDSQGRKLVNERLSSKSPRLRYETMQNLCYVNDAGFVPKVKSLLSDKTAAIRVGSVRNYQMRRVADGAVDSLVCLLNLDLPFKPSKNLYTDEEINRVRSMINK